jgi:hypothetical protein
MSDLNELIVKRLDQLVAIMQLAYADQIAAAKKTLRADPVNTAILDAADDWIRVGQLQQQVVGKTAVSSRTVNRRIQELLVQQALEQRGASVSLEYKATGLL